MRKSAASSRSRSATRRFTLSHARRPHRAAGRRPLRHPRLQDRRSADREAGADPALAPQLTLEGRDPARRRLRGHRRQARRSPSIVYVDAARRRAGGRSQADRLQGRRRPTAEADTRAGRLTELPRRFAERRHALSLAACIRCGRPRYGDYDHLARVKEWSVTGGAETTRGEANERAAHHPRRGAERSSTRRPIPASRPGSSANAGSGKTHVLAQRVIRLLLDGVEPAKILCITFTKAAAANMANRVFDTLGRMDRARRRRARRAIARSRTRRRTQRCARGRGGCSRSRWRRRAA